MPHSSIQAPEHLLEALCEVRFAQDAHQPIAAEKKARFAEALRPHYPHQVQGTDHRVGLEVQTQGQHLHTRVTPPGPRHVFRSLSNMQMVQLTDSSLSVHLLAPYAGWQALRTVAGHLWALCRETLEVRASAQVVLRFVNRFERSTAAPHIEDWLAAGPFLPQGVLDAKAGFLVKTQLQSSSEVLTTAVTSGTLAVSEQSRMSALPLLLDIEVTRDTAAALPTVNFSSMLDAMHTQAREAFEVSCGPAAHRAIAALH